MLIEVEIDQPQTQGQIQLQLQGLMSIKEEIVEAQITEVKAIPARTQLKFVGINTKIYNEHSLIVAITIEVIQLIERILSLLGQIAIQEAIINILDLQILEAITISHLEMQRSQIVLTLHRVAYNLPERNLPERSQLGHSPLGHSLRAVLNRLEV